jgi:DNA-binding transcriptional MerR regulator
MKDLVLIGRFAQLTQLTIKALHLYDERGLLRPAVVDFRSGFRYYSLDQVALAERIRLLRSLEMPLEEIRAVLDADDVAAVQSRLANHKEWIEGRIQGYQHALKLLHAVDEQHQIPEEGSTIDSEQASTSYRCSFCGRVNTAVERLIAGPNGVYICSECVGRCNEIIAKERSSV